MLETTVSITGLILTIGGVSAAMWAVTRVKGMEVSIKILNDANEGLRDANADLAKRLIDSERSCAERISNLEGQNQVLTQGLGETIVTSISDHLERALNRIVNRALERLETKGNVS